MYFELPPDKHLEVVLKRGLILRMSGDIPFKSDHPHHFVVLNHDPSRNEVIVLTNGTHQVIDVILRANRTQAEAKTVHVIPPGKYDFFPQQTAFDCNSPYPVSFDKLARAMREKHLTLPPEAVLKDEDINALIAGVLASGEVIPRIKRLIDPDYR